MDEAEDVAPVMAVLTQRFAHLLGRADEKVEQRAREERRASQTEGEKGRRRGPPKLQFNVRATQETRDLIDALAEHHGKSLSDVIELAADALAKAAPDFKGSKG